MLRAPRPGEENCQAKHAFFMRGWGISSSMIVKNFTPFCTKPGFHSSRMSIGDRANTLNFATSRHAHSITISSWSWLDILCHGPGERRQIARNIASSHQ